MGVPWRPERGSEKEGKPGASVWRTEIENAALLPNSKNSMSGPKTMFYSYWTCSCWKAKALMRSFQNILSLIDICSVPTSVFLDCFPGSIPQMMRCLFPALETHSQTWVLLISGAKDSDWGRAQSYSRAMPTNKEECSEQQKHPPAM